MTNSEDTIVPVVKIVTVWGAVGITSWSDFAAFLASIYTTVLIGEWLWKKAGRPFCERHGWIKRQYRRKEDRS